MIIQRSEYDSSLKVDTNNNRYVDLQITDCDNSNTMEITVYREHVKALVSELSQWLDRTSAVDYVSTNEKFSWFNSRSDD